MRCSQSSQHHCAAGCTRGSAGVPSNGRAHPAGLRQGGDSVHLDSGHLEIFPISLYASPSILIPGIMRIILQSELLSFHMGKGYSNQGTSVSLSLSSPLFHFISWHISEQKKKEENLS